MAAGGPSITHHAALYRKLDAHNFDHIARDAVDLFGHNTEHRIRECSAADCTFVFFDESRTNNRRWCSMQRCGNRAKVRAFRAKTAAR